MNDPKRKMLDRHITEEWALSFGKLRISLKALIILVLFIGIFAVLIVNVGYDSQQGCYWRPADVKVHIEKKK